MGPYNNVQVVMARNLLKVGKLLFGSKIASGNNFRKILNSIETLDKLFGVNVGITNSIRKSPIILMGKTKFLSRIGTIGLIIRQMLVLG